MKTITKGSGITIEGQDEPDKDEILLVLCNCSSPEHQFQFSYTPEPGWDELCFQVYLEHHPSFFGRLKTAVRYLFNRKSRYSGFADVLFGEKEAEDIVRFLRGYLEFRKANNVQRDG